MSFGKSIMRHASPIRRISNGPSLRAYSTSFADLFRQSVSSLPIKKGDPITGYVVGHRRPRSVASQITVVDFGLKSEASFTAKELPTTSTIGTPLTKNILLLEDDFNEPVFDLGKSSDLPAQLAERYRALLSITSNQAQLLHGRISSYKRGGVAAKVLGFDAFTPRHHVMSLKPSIVGSYAPFYLLSVASARRPAAASQLPGIDLYPVVSSYGGILFSLANLVGFDDAWKASGGGSPRERLAYLQLLTRVLYQKNTMARSMMPKTVGGHMFARHHPRFQQGEVAFSGRTDSAEDGRTGKGTRREDSLRWLEQPDFPRVWQKTQRHNTAQRPSSRRGSVVVGGFEREEGNLLHLRSLPRRHPSNTTESQPWKVPPTRAGLEQDQDSKNVIRKVLSKNRPIRGQQRSDSEDK